MVTMVHHLNEVGAAGAGKPGGQRSTRELTSVRIAFYSMQMEHLCAACLMAQLVQILWLDRVRGIDLLSESTFV